jgi:hypothetical protein
MGEFRPKLDYTSAKGDVLLTIPLCFSSYTGLSRVAGLWTCTTRFSHLFRQGRNRGSDRDGFWHCGSLFALC